MLSTVRGHTFVPAAMRRRPTVVDLGSHRGEFAVALRDLFGARCHAVEASPVLYGQIPRGEGLHPHQVAIADRDGPVAFYLSDQAEGSSIHEHGAPGKEVTVRANTLTTLLSDEAIRFVDLLKVDIEGAEEDLFRSTPDETLLRIGQITIEFHDFLGLTDAAAIKGVRDRLRRLGFFELKMSRDNTNWLFLQRRVSDVSLARLLAARYIERNLAGLRRVLARRRAGRH